MAHPVTLSSDFGAYYPAAMRGVVAARGVNRIHDVTHELPAHDIGQAAFWLRELLPYYPPAVHCVVVDPGVGTDRSVIVLRAGGHALVGPDNGVLWPVATRLASDEPAAFTFDHVPPASHTFHGRDVFAPLAAAVANIGIDRLNVLPTIAPATAPTTYELPSMTRHDDTVVADILAVDRFGNAITNVPGFVIEPMMGATVAIDGESVPVRPTYGAVEPGTALVTIGSHGYVELAANQSAGADAFDVSVGERVSISIGPG